jgi:hypothetical protein
MVGWLAGWLVQDVQQDSSYNSTIIIIIIVGTPETITFSKSKEEFDDIASYLNIRNLISKEYDDNM